MSILSSLIKKITTSNKVEVKEVQKEELNTVKKAAKRVSPRDVVVGGNSFIESGKSFIKEYVLYLEKMEGLKAEIESAKQEILDFVGPIFARLFSEELKTRDGKITTLNVHENGVEESLSIQFKNKYSKVAHSKLVQINSDIGLGLTEKEVATKNTNFSVDLSFMLKPDGSINDTVKNEVVSFFSKYGVPVVESTSYVPSESFHNALWSSNNEHASKIARELGQSVAFIVGKD